MVTLITDHIARGLRRRLRQYREKPRLEGMLSVFLRQVQEIEDAAFDMFTSQWVDFATGAQLDRFGDIVVQGREGFDDDFYRILLKTKIGINNSNGEPGVVTNTIKILTQSTLVHYQNLGDGSVMFGVDGPVDLNLLDFIFKNIDKVIMGGVRLDYLVGFDPDESFSMDGVGPIGLGFSSLAAPTTGGKLAFLYRRTTPVFAFSAVTPVADPSAAGFGTLADPLAGGLLQGL